MNYRMTSLLLKCTASFKVAKTSALLMYLLVGVSALVFTNSVVSKELDPLKCTIIIDAGTGSTLHTSGECSQRVSPCSSFKIPLAIMGFESGILQSPTSPAWELRPEYNPSKRDMMYREVYPALWQRDSVVWFSQQLTTHLGATKFAEYVKKFEYGNQDISGDPGKDDGLTRSWLMSSLAISPEEQVRFLRRFIAHQLPISMKTYDLVCATVPQYKAAGGWVVHGKSGSGWLRSRDGMEDENRPQGWFVGWAEKDKRQVVFARLEIGSRKSDVPGGTRAREEILNELHTLLAGR